jgi:hypothetical protein
MPLIDNIGLLDKFYYNDVAILLTVVSIYDDGSFEFLIGEDPFTFRSRIIEFNDCLYIGLRLLTKF